MVTIFIKKNGDFFIELLPDGDKFNSTYFNHVIIPQICNLAFPDGKVKYKKRALLHFDNATSHKEQHVMETLNENHFKLILNPPYSPDISPLDFVVFGTIKEMMPPEIGESVNELKYTINEILRGLGKSFIRNVFSAWENRLQQVIDTNELYI